MLIISDRIRIPGEELQFSYVRSSGPGGQNVNKLNTKAILRWAVRTSPSLPDDVRQRFVRHYPSKLTGEGEILITSQRFRDQRQNQRDCLEKLREMLLIVARPPKRRKPTRPTKASVLRKQVHKRAHSLKKRHRRPAHED